MFPMSVLHLYYVIEIVKSSNNGFMLLTDVLISISQSVEFVDRNVCVVLEIMSLYA